MTYTGLTKSSYQLSLTPFKIEGDIFQLIGRSDKKVAKIYHSNKVTQELKNKLKYMV